MRTQLGTLAVAESVEMERHLSSCARCARTLRAFEVAGSAYDHAFAKLRSRRTHIAAGRARLASATERRVGLGFAVPSRVLRLRLAKSALAFGVMTLAVVGSLGIEPSRPNARPPEPVVPVATAVATPQPEDPQRIRAARLRYGDVGDMVFRVTPGTPY
ncbi:MAG: hypothetical protein AABM32_00700 [Chloroflexota bacterium]